MTGRQAVIVLSGYNDFQVWLDRNPDHGTTFQQPNHSQAFQHPMNLSISQILGQHLLFKNLTNLTTGTEGTLQNPNYLAEHEIFRREYLPVIFKLEDTIDFWPQNVTFTLKFGASKYQGPQIYMLTIKYFYYTIMWLFYLLLYFCKNKLCAFYYPPPIPMKDLTKKLSSSILRPYFSPFARQPTTILAMKDYSCQLPQLHVAVP